jgi:hypothetical protein
MKCSYKQKAENWDRSISPKKTNRTTSIGWILILSCLFLITAPFRAKAEEEDKFEELYQKGISYYEKQMFAEAAQAFREVFKIRTDYQTYFNIGQCEFLLKHYDLALEWLTIYVEKGGDKIEPKRREYVDEVIESIEPLVGYVEIKESNTFNIWVDDIHRGYTPLNRPLFMMEGEHELVLKKGNETVFKKYLTVKKGETIVVDVPPIAPLSEPRPEKPAGESQKKAPLDTADETTGTAEPVTAPLSRKPTSSILRNVGIITAGVGGVAVVTGIVTGSLALSKGNQLSDRCPDKKQLCPKDAQDLRDSASLLAITSNVLLPLGGTVLVTGVVLAILGHKRTAETRETSSLSVLPFGSQDSAFLVLNGSF